MTYKVANPRGLPKGTPIVGVTKKGKTKRWVEGDPIKPTDAFSKEGWQSWIDGGFVEEVLGG